MIRLGVLASAIVISSATAAWAAAVTPGTYGSTDTTATAGNTESQSNSTATANTYPGAKAKIGQRKKTYMTPTANPMRTGNCSAIEMSGQATLNGQPMNGGSPNPATGTGTGAKAVGQGINKGSGGSPACWEERGTELPAPQ